MNVTELSTYLATAAALLVVLGGCRGDAPDDDESLKRRLERQAASRADKASANIGAIHHVEGISGEPPVRVDLQEGGALEIEEAYLVVSAVEMHACEPGVDDYDAPDGPLLNDLWPLIGGTAHAHVPDSATRLGTPYVENLLAEPGRASVVGELAPPLAAYCRIVAVLAPADGDVYNTTGLATDEIVGHTLLVRGRHRSGPEADWNAFEITSEAARPVELEAIDPRTGDSPLVFASRDAGAMLLVDKTLRPETFATAPDAPEAGRRILDRLAESMRLHEFDGGE